MCIREKHLFHNDISPHFKFLSNERLDFCEFFKQKIKRINNADSFSQPSLIIFTKGANNSDHDCIYIYIYTVIIFIFIFSVFILNFILHLLFHVLLSFFIFISVLVIFVLKLLSVSCQGNIF